MPRRPAPEVMSRPVGHATLVVDCNDAKARVDASRQAALEAIATMRDLTMKCGHVPGPAKAMLVIDELSVPRIQELYGNAVPVTNHHHRTTWDVNHNDLKLERELVARQFESYTRTSGLREAVNKQLGENPNAALPAVIQKAKNHR